MSIYRVTGTWPYRGHEPGELFDAALEFDVERRAVQHGVIEVVKHTRPGLRPGSYSRPRNWKQLRKQEAMNDG